MQEKARAVKRHIISMSYRSKTAEIGSALSIADILTALYFSVLKIHPKKPEDPKRDRFILSKGHGSAALYATLALRGFFPEKNLDGYRKDNGTLHGHPCRDAAPGIEVSTGSLGHGLSIGAGVGLALRKDVPQARVFVLVGDGECNEGSIWEAAMFIATHGLTNVITIVDDNNFQGFGASAKVHTMDIARKFESFGFEVRKVDGHNLAALAKVLSKKPGKKPVVIIAKTVAGKGIPKIENTLLAHYYIPDEATYTEAIKKLA
jgi:transketolase